MIKIITDGSCDLPQEWTNRYDVSVVPLSVHFGNETFASDLDSDYFFKRMSEEAELPKTSSPSPMDFIAKFKESLKEYSSILVLSCTSKLSSTYHHALMAKEMMQEEGCDHPIEVLDAKTTSAGLGTLVARAAQMAKEGIHYDELVDKMKRHIQETRTYFTLDTLENVIKGGRLDRFKGTVASVLNIKLVMKASEEGAIEVVEKLRGMPKALKRLIEKVGETWHAGDKRIITIAHANCEERARELLRQIMLLYPFEQAIVTNMGPIIGTYSGEGGIVISY